jgi:hypothetical protein
MKMTVDLPASFLKQAEAVAARRGQELPELIAEVLRQALPRPAPKASKPLRKKRKKPLPPLSEEARAWLRDWEQWSRDISARVKTSDSAAELISRMRR